MINCQTVFHSFRPVIIPQYQMLASVSLTNSIFALVFPGIVSAFGTFFLRQSYLGIPNEIGEAAYLDGCNQWQTFTKVMAPLTGNSVAALTIFTAVFAYADLMWPLVVNTDINMMTLSSGLATLKGQFTTNYPVLMAGSLLAMIPMLVLYLFFQKQFVEGIAMTGGKAVADNFFKNTEKRDIMRFYTQKSKVKLR